MIEKKEKDIERFLCRRVVDAGGKAYKWTSPGNSGVPDRIILMPGGLVYFVEVKAPGKEPRPLQIKQMSDISNLGGDVRVVDSEKAAIKLVEEAQRKAYAMKRSVINEI